MKKLLLFLMLTIVSSSAMAEWVEVGSNAHGFGGEYIITILKDIVSEDENNKEFSLLVDYWITNVRIRWKAEFR